jgi:MFS family permease
VDGGVLFVLCPIYGEGKEPLGLLELGVDLNEFKRENRDLILTLFLSVISVSVVMIVITVELLVFVDGRRKMMDAASSVPVEMMRSATFLVYFITNLSTGFLPLYARNMIAADGRAFLFPTAFLIAAPISADVLLGAVGSLLGDRIVRKLGFRRAAMAGSAVITAGICLEALSYDIFMLTAGFAVCGFGCGLILFLVHLKIAGEALSAERDRGFSGVTVAMASGINGGVVFGAFLINWLPQRAVLGVSAAMSLLLLAFSARYMTKGEISSLEASAKKASARKESSENGKIGLLRFLASPRAFLYLLGLWGPTIASGYFIIYLFPIVGFDLGISESHIGYAFLLNSLIVVFFSASLTRAASAKFGKPVSLTLWTLLYAGSFAAFAFFQNIPALLLALVLIGSADSFGQSLATSYYTELPEVVQYGYGRAIGISNVVDNIFQTLGPFVFSYALHVGLSKGLLQIAGVLAALSVIFLLSSARRGKR